MIPQYAMSETLLFSFYFGFPLILVSPLFWFSTYSYRPARPNVPLENLFKFYGASPDRFSTPSNILGQVFYKLKFLCKFNLASNFAAEYEGAHILESHSGGKDLQLPVVH